MSLSGFARRILKILRVSKADSCKKPRMQTFRVRRCIRGPCGDCVRVALGARLSDYGVIAIRKSVMNAEMSKKFTL